MTVWVIVIGGETTQSTEDKTTLFHLFHIDAIPFHPFHISTLKAGLIYIEGPHPVPPIPHLHPESGAYIYISPTFRVEMWNGWNRMWAFYIYKARFQGGDVEWVEWNGIYVE